jgi:uncharacterized membrane protein YbhN (UPF0104 family)
VIALILLVYLLRQQGWEEIKAALIEIEPWRLVLALLLMVISRLAVAIRWHTLLKSGGMQISPEQTVQITFAGLFASNFLPTTIGGDVIRLAGALRLNFDVAISAASLIADRLVGMAGMLMILPVGLPRLLQIQDLLPTSALSIQLGLAAIPRSGFFAKVKERLLRILRRLFSALTVWLRQPRALLLSLFFTWVHQACLFSILTLFFVGMGQDISFWLVGGLYSFVYLITLIPISINGYGLQEISMTVVFSRLGGVSLASSLTAALLLRTVVMLASLPGVVFVPGLLAYSRQRPEAKNAPPADIV